MACQSLLHRGCVYLVTWRGPTTADVDRACRDVREAAAQHGGPILSIWLVPEDTPAPRGDVRAAMSREMPELLRCSEVHNVLEGSSVKTRILRSIVTNLFQVSNMGGRMFVYKSFDEALLALSPKLRRYQVDAAELKAQALQAGLLTSAPPIDAGGAAPPPP